MFTHVRAPCGAERGSRVSRRGRIFFGLGASSWLMLAHFSHFFALVAHFFDFLTHLKLSCIFVTFFGVSGVIFRGFGRVWGGILGGFFDDF